MRLFRCATLALTSVVLLAANPSVTGVYNAAGWQPTGLPNSGVAQGSIFTVTGSGHGPSTLEQAQTYPLQTTLGGTSIRVQVGGATESCIMIYSLDGQVAAILPSATPVGTGTLSLSYGGATSSMNIQVLPANFGTFTLNEGGTGPAVVTDSSYTPITLVHPAHPGDTLVLWGTGLGPITGDETNPPQSVDLRTGVQVFVGNQAAKVTYGGRSSSPGLDQINFVVPASVGGCKTSVAVLLKGITGNITSTAVAPAGQSTCGDTFNALTADNLQKAVANGHLNIAETQLSRVGDGGDKFEANFEDYPLDTLIRSYGGNTGPSVGSCLAYTATGSAFEATDPVQPQHLDAGPQMTIEGPGGTRTITASSTGSYEETLATAAPYYIAPGNYTLSNGTGGGDVAGFTSTLTLPSNVTPVSLPAEVNRAQDLTLAWTGSTGFSVVTIFGISGVPITSTSNAYVEFICNADASAGQMTIPAAILNLLPPDGYGSKGVHGVDLQIAGVAISRFTAAGIDTGIFNAFISSGVVAAIQ